METITFVAALRHNKMTAPMVVEGAMTGEMFLAYIEQCLVPTLRRNDIVVMDNCRVHMGPAIREAIEKAHATLRYLPKYSPDLNPIELPYSKFKAFLRKVAARTIPASLKQFARSSHSSVRANVPTISGMQAMLQYDRNPQRSTIDVGPDRKGLPSAICLILASCTRIFGHSIPGLWSLPTFAHFSGGFWRPVSASKNSVPGGNVA